jgi:CPA1 family monovalent cation:H+ antiporter
MQGGDAPGAQLVFVILLLAVVAFAALARKLRLPYPIVLVLGGLLVSFVPGLPRITLEPGVIFFVVLPPLLYAAAWHTSWREFSYHLVNITSLAIGLVSFTVAGVALAAPLILPAFDWQTGLVLGAVVSTTDAIAATSIARRMGLPRRIVDVLEGESLLNDATGLLALEFGVSTGEASSQQGRPVDPRHHSRFRDLSRERLQVERDAALRLRDERRIDDDTLRQIEHELDLAEARLQAPRRR